MFETKKIVYLSGSGDAFRVCENLLKTAGDEFSISFFSSAEDLTDEIFRVNPFCFVLDDTLQDRVYVRQLIERIRKHDRNTIIIMLLDTTAAERRLEVYRDGADGYICRPFYPEELICCLRVHMRCSVRETNAKKVLLAHATVDIETAEVTKKSYVSHLTGKEYKIFMLLLANAGKIVSVRALCEALCGENWEGYERTLLTHIYHIREKIEEKPSAPVSLITVKGLGYRLNIIGMQ